MRPSKKWMKKAELYKTRAIAYFEEANLARHHSLGEPIVPCPYDFSEKAALDMFIYESTGIGDVGIDIFNGKLNGYAIGKKWMDVEINREPLDA